MEFYEANKDLLLFTAAAGVKVLVFLGGVMGLAGLLAAAIWGVLFVAQLTTTTAAGGWAWIALFGFAAAFGALAQARGLLEEVRVARVEEVEDPVGEDDLQALAPPAPAQS